eukprot:3006928-Amphidinium_carterae.1
MLVLLASLACTMEQGACSAAEEGRIIIKEEETTLNNNKRNSQTDDRRNRSKIRRTVEIAEAEAQNRNKGSTRATRPFCVNGRPVC